MLVIPLEQYTSLALLLMRLLVAAIFISSGWAHLTHSAERSKSIGQSVGFTIFLGAAELAGALGLIFGVLTQWAAVGLILVMLGAISKKIFAWHIGFWGEKGSGWHYELMIVAMLLVILTANGGLYVLIRQKY